MNALFLPTEVALCEVCSTNNYIKKEAQGLDYEYSTTQVLFEIVRCARCGLVYILNRPTLGALSTIYPENYYSFDEAQKQSSIVKFVRSKLELKKLIRLKKLLVKKKVSILDIGCGDGRLLDLLKKTFGVNHDYSGIELDESAVMTAKRKGYNVTKKNIDTYNVTDLIDTYDLVLMHQVIEHTRSPRQVIRKIYSILKKGGILSIETPDTNSWDHHLFRKKYWGGYHIPRHFYLFDKRNISLLLEEEEFEIISCKSILSPVFWIHSIHNYLIDQQITKGCAKFFHYQNPILLILATLIDYVQIMFFSKSSNMQILARKK